MNNNEYITISDINRIIKFTIESNLELRSVYLKGEISNIKYHGRGHLYFSLKDETSKINAVMFNYKNSGMDFNPKDGDSVLVHGRVSVYEASGSYQIYVDSMQLDGIGNLYVLFEQLKKKLHAEGLFDPAHKKKIRRVPRKIGVITASTGAAVRDIIQITRRRNPYVQIILYPAIVQGEAAAASIVNGIRTLDRMGLDVLIVGRGGGSIEDLWAFNEEDVARAIFACNTPVISAVGHETDVTISDYVADLRAPTPSAAAELAVFDYERFQADIDGRKRKLDREMGYFLDQVKSRLKRDELKIELHHPQNIINEKRQMLANMEDSLNRMMERRLEQYKKRLAVISGTMWGLSPLKKLSQGYGFVTDEQGERLASIEQAPVGSRIHVQVADGKLTAAVEERQEAEGWKN